MDTGQPSDGERVLALTEAGSDASAIVTAWRKEYDPEHLVADGHPHRRVLRTRPR